MIISATFSKPSKLCKEKFEKEYLKVSVKINSAASSKQYFAEFFTEKQTFHQHFTEDELNKFIDENAGITFKNVIIKSESEEITILSNKKGKITKISKPVKNPQFNNSAQRILTNSTKNVFQNGQRIKNYIIQEGNPIPFLVFLGVMTDSGKVISSKYDKFRQINRFLEFIDDVEPILRKKIFKDEKQIRPLRICDFGSGKSYLTFAVHYYFTEIKNIEVEITGLDLKKDVIEYCNKTAQTLNCKGLKFEVGNISDYDKEFPDLIITLHACDTATDFALEYAVKRNCSVILSVPCCQHEINIQLDKNLKEWKKNNSVPEEFEPLLKYGLIKERFSALVTDSLRCEYLENSGYSVQALEFIDAENTPKNLLIRAVKKENFTKQENKKFTIEEKLNISPMIKNLI